jgi:chitinase
MRTYTFTTTVSPMDDTDLACNYKKMRRRFWTRHGLWIPPGEVVKFEKIRRTKQDIGKPPLLGECDGGIIRINPILKHVWVQAHTTLLHEMAHLYVGCSTNWDGRFNGHGERFNKEIDRLYALGAFRKLI